MVEDRAGPHTPKHPWMLAAVSFLCPVFLSQCAPSYIVSRAGSPQALATSSNFVSSATRWGIVAVLQGHQVEHSSGRVRHGFGVGGICVAELLLLARAFCVIDCSFLSFNHAQPLQSIVLPSFARPLQLQKQNASFAAHAF